MGIAIDENENLEQKQKRTRRDTKKISRVLEARRRRNGMVVRSRNPSFSRVDGEQRKTLVGCSLSKKSRSRTGTVCFSQFYAPKHGIGTVSGYNQTHHKSWYYCNNNKHHTYYEHYTNRHVPHTAECPFVNVQRPEFRTGRTTQGIKRGLSNDGCFGGDIGGLVLARATGINFSAETTTTPPATQRAHYIRVCQWWWYDDGIFLAPGIVHDFVLQ